MKVTLQTDRVFCFKLSNSCGVYFLKLNGKIVYIGKSTNVFSRIFSNHVVDKKFDEVEIHWLPRDQIAQYEKHQIQLHKPALNDWDNSRKVEMTRKAMLCVNVKPASKHTNDLTSAGERNTSRSLASRVIALPDAPARRRHRQARDSADAMRLARRAEVRSSAGQRHGQQQS